MKGWTLLVLKIQYCHHNRLLWRHSIVITTDYCDVTVLSSQQIIVTSQYCHHNRLLWRHSIVITTDYYDVTVLSSQQIIVTSQYYHLNRLLWRHSPDVDPTWAHMTENSPAVILIWEILGSESFTRWLVRSVKARTSTGLCVTTAWECIKFNFFKTASKVWVFTLAMIVRTTEAAFIFV